MCDALQWNPSFPNGMLFTDDQQVTTILARKFWANSEKEAGMNLIVCQLGDVTGDVMGWLLA